MSDDGRQIVDLEAQIADLQSGGGAGLPEQWATDDDSGALTLSIADGGSEDAAVDITVPDSGDYMNEVKYILRVLERVAGLDLVRLGASDGANGYTEIRLAQPGGGGAANIFVGSYGITLRDATGNRVFRLLTSGVVTTLAHAAPADGTLLTGEMALWFDQTHGAAKLMIKAKDANGSIVTGELPLA